MARWLALLLPVLVSACAHADPTLQPSDNQGDAAGAAGQGQGGASDAGGAAGTTALAGQPGAGGSAGSAAGSTPGGQPGAGGAQAGSGQAGSEAGGQAGGEAGSGNAGGEAGSGMAGSGEAGSGAGGGEAGSGQAGSGNAGGSTAGGAGGSAAGSGGGTAGSGQAGGDGGQGGSAAGQGGGPPFGAGGSAGQPSAGSAGQSGAGGAGGAASPCEACTQAAVADDCKNQQDACDATPECGQLADCITACQTDSCPDKCQTKFPKGVSPLSNLLTCVCDIACPVKCAAECGGSGGSGGSGGTGGDTCAHSACLVGGPLTPGCSPCAQTICQADAICCSQGWDGFCVGEASTVPACGCLSGVQGCQASRTWANIDSGTCTNCLLGTCQAASDEVDLNCGFNPADACKVQCGSNNACYCSCVTNAANSSQGCATAIEYFYGCIGNNCKSACD